MKDVVIIIPALNEEKSLGLVLDNIPKERVIAIIVADNNSSDDTPIIAQQHGAIVVKETRRGYGSACLKGLDEARGHNPKIIVFLDADYSDHPQELPLLLEAIDGGFDLVIGSRTLGKAEPGSLLPQAIFGNWLATNLMHVLVGGTKFTDLGPFRAVTWQALEKVQMCDTNFGWTVELQMKAIIHGLRCTEVSVSYRKRIGVSKITGTISGTLKAGYKIISTILRYWIVSRSALY